MLAHLSCFPCFLEDLLCAMEALQLPVAKREEILGEALAFLSRGWDKKTYPSYYITHLHRILKEKTGFMVPFADLRERANEAGLKMASRMAREIEGIRDEKARFMFLSACSIAANAFDFRTAGEGYGLDPEGLAASLEGLVRQGLARDEREEIFQAVTHARELVFVHDNVGEIALDALLIEEIKRKGVPVFSLLRGGPITSDATVEDGKAVGLFKKADGILTTGSDTLGILPEDLSEGAKRKLFDADMVIAKGQANYYTFSEFFGKMQGNVACYFSTKCDLVSSIFNAKGKVRIALFLRK